MPPAPDLLPLSALQHLAYCERQCALIHVERVWVENRFTAEGRVLHERVDSGESEARRDLRIARGVGLRSLRLGLSGRADVVELHRVPEAAGGTEGAEVPGLDGRWRPVPVESKRGRPKDRRCDEIQLCAQALCLEEMFGVEIPEGALYYGKTRRRTRVRFDPELRQATEQAARRVHELVEAEEVPPPVADERCDRCSLLEICLPFAPERSAREYLEAVRREALAEASGP